MSAHDDIPGVAMAISHGDPIAPVIFGVSLILVATLIGRHLARRTQQPSGLGVRNHGLNRLVVGVGMLPRGEVGLVFASIGRSPGVTRTEVFSAIVSMVIVTTFGTPPMLKEPFTQDGGHPDMQDPLAH